MSKNKKSTRKKKMNYFTEKFVEITNESGMPLLIQVEAREKTNYFALHLSLLSKDPQMQMIDAKHLFNEGDLKKYSCSFHSLFLVKIYDLSENLIRETILTPGDFWIVVKERLMLPQKKPIDESEKKPLQQLDNKPGTEYFLYGLCFLGGVLCTNLVNRLKHL